MPALAAPSPALVDELRRIVGAEGVLSDPEELIVYECDGLPIAKGQPSAVAFPVDTAQVSACVRTLAREDVQIVARGAGTGLAGGAVVFGGGVILCTSRMTRIEQIDLAGRVALVQAGVCNLALSEAVAAACAGTPMAAFGGALRFAPDPSSQRASTIGGNAATNAGGLATLKYGVTADHILGLEMVLADGTVVTTRPGGVCDGLGPDLPGLICGSEGTLGIITRLWCRLTPRPRAFRTLYAVFHSTGDACRAVSDTIASGLITASLEMMDGAMIRVVEEAFHFGFPAEAQALLLIEIDGLAAGLDDQLEQLLAICRRHGAHDIRQCSDAAQRARLWSVRKRAFGAIGRISHGYCTQDACIPRSKLPQAMEAIGRLGRKYGLRISSVFHAGDGNVHPVLLFDEDDPAQVQRTLQLSEEILDYCVSLGGTITGEHGVGVEKLHVMPRMFNPATIRAFQSIKDALDPRHRLNDGKLIPSDTLRIELHRPAALNTPGGAL